MSPSLTPCFFIMFIHLQNSVAYLWGVWEPLGRIKEDLLKPRKKSLSICTEGREENFCVLVEGCVIRTAHTPQRTEIIGIQACSPEPTSSWKRWSPPCGFSATVTVIKPADSQAESGEEFVERRELLTFCYRSAEVVRDLGWLHALHLIFHSWAPASRRGSCQIMRSDTRCEVPALSNLRCHRHCHKEALWEINLNPTSVWKDSEAVCCYFYADSLTKRLEENCWVTDHEKQFQLISVSDPY